MNQIGKESFFCLDFVWWCCKYVPFYDILPIHFGKKTTTTTTPFSLVLLYWHIVSFALAHRIICYIYESSGRFIHTVGYDENQAGYFCIRCLASIWPIHTHTVNIEWDDFKTLDNISWPLLNATFNYISKTRRIHQIIFIIDVFKTLIQWLCIYYNVLTYMFITFLRHSFVW